VCNTGRVHPVVTVAVMEYRGRPVNLIGVESGMQA
jgi:hypothetical protein